LYNFASGTLHCLAQRPRPALIGYWRNIDGKLIIEEREFDDTSVAGKSLLQ